MLTQQVVSNNMRPPLQNNLALIRRHCRLSQAEVSALLRHHLGRNVDFTTISAHENMRRHINAEEIQAYARIYKVPSQMLFSKITDETDLKKQLANTGWEKLNA